MLCSPRSLECFSPFQQPQLNNYDLQYFPLYMQLYMLVYGPQKKVDIIYQMYS